ncbi:MAG TPA: response regulator [Symbiobacteriaceae bacterium]|nr:response regulator [Symbiobacteriaceae bacterium]
MNTTLTVLAVDRNRHNLELLEQFLGGVSYRIKLASSLGEFDEALASGEPISIGLIDLVGFDPGIWARCEQLRARNIPFLVLSSRPSPVLQHESLSHGAQGVLLKPLTMRQLLGLIHALLGG